MITPTEISTLIDQYVEFENKEKTSKQAKELIKAKLQAAGFEELENKNIKQVEYFGKSAVCTVGYSEKLTIDNYKKLKEILCKEVNLDEQVKIEKVEKITPDSKFKTALIILYKGDYKPCNIDDVVKSFGLEDKDNKVIMKKLKGDYNKDKRLLEKYGINNSVEEELDAIRGQKNYDLVQKYFGNLSNINIEEFKRTMTLEETLSIGINAID